MIVIIDVNMVFSAIIKPRNTVGSSLFSKAHGHIFTSPNFLKEEILKHNERILKITGYKNEYLEAIKSAIYHRIEFYFGKLVSQECWNHANAIMKCGDEKMFHI